MKEKMLSLVDAMRCAEQKIRECRAQRESLMAKVAELNEAISYQEGALGRSTQELDLLLTRIEAQGDIGKAKIQGTSEA